MKEVGEFKVSTGEILGSSGHSWNVRRGAHMAGAPRVVDRPVMSTWKSCHFHESHWHGRDAGRVPL